MPTNVPVNKDAGTVVTKKGVDYKPAKKITQTHSGLPLETRPVPRCASDLTGTTFGKFRVIGLYAKEKGHWVVRCVCGNYETRKAKSIKNPNNNVDRCQKCRHLAYLQRNDRFRQDGFNDD